MERRGREEEVVVERGERGEEAGERRWGREVK